MTYLSGTGGQITVNDDNGFSLVVVISDQTGAPLTVYSDATRTTPVTFPDTITGTKTYYFASDSTYIVSTKLNGIEIAGYNGATVRVPVSGGRSFGFAPGIDPLELASEIGQGGASIPVGTYEPAGLSSSTLATLNNTYAPKAGGGYEPSGLSNTTKTYLAGLYQPVGSYQAAGSYEPAGLSSSTNTALAATYQAKGSYEPSGLASGTLSTLDARYAPLGASYKMALSSSGDTLTDGYVIEPNGIPIVSNQTVSAFCIVLDFPAAVDQQWELVAFHADGTWTQLTTVTITAGTRGAVANSLAASVVAGDVLLADVLTTFGTSYGGYGPSARVAFGGSLSLPSAPTAITTFSSSATSNSVTLNWTLPANARSALISRYNAVTARHEGYAIARGTTFTDTGLTQGQTYKYKLYAAIPGACSTATSEISVTTTTSYSFFSQSDGAPSGWTVVSGGGSGTSATVTGNVLHLVSGSAGNLATADKEGVMFSTDATTHKFWSLSGQFCLDQANSIFDIYLSAGVLDSTFGFGNSFLQFEFTPSQGRIGFKAPTYSSGSFQTLFAYTNYGTTVNANGTAFYGFKVDLVDNGDGTGTAHLYQGTTSQLAAGTLPLLGSGTVTATMLSALSAGRCSIVQLGRTDATAGTTCGSKFQGLTLIPA